MAAPVSRLTASERAMLAELVACHGKVVPGLFCVRVFFPISSLGVIAICFGEEQLLHYEARARDAVESDANQRAYLHKILTIPDLTSLAGDAAVEVERVLQRVGGAK